MVAALRLAMRACGATGIRGLLKRSFDFRRIADKQCYMPDLLMPVGNALEDAVWYSWFTRASVSPKQSFVAPSLAQPRCDAPRRGVASHPLPA